MKLALVVRTDLGMGKGKIAAQVAHAAVAAALRSLGSPDFAEWRAEGEPKVVLKVSGEEQLRLICEAAGAAGLAVDLVQDAGRTQIAAGTVTCCAIGPAADSRLDRVTGALSLL